MRRRSAFCRPRKGKGRRRFLLIAALALCACPAAADPLDLAIGKAVFDRMWAHAPASTQHADGLGPLFVARSCASCHAGSGGRTTFRLGRDDPGEHPGLVVKLADDEGRPDPFYGAELQTQGLLGAVAEGKAGVVLGDDGRPRWRIDGRGYGPLAPGTRMSPRVAPSLFGVGLLERVDEAAILAREDPDDRNGDGVSGRAHRLADRSIGRFGWKASEPTLERQAASAFALDLGLSTVIRPDGAGDCTEWQVACLASPQGAPPGEAEVAEPLMTRLVAFLDSRPAPVTEPAAGKGPRLFATAGCGACHAPSLPLKGGGEAKAFTDLLLHDLGPDLDDGAGEAGAASAEWRTAPLWGVARALAQGSGLLHDGRAATVAEAIRWHGGEAEGAKRRFERLSSKDRDALTAYVEGL
ncbi:di-heme oxidoredictase family protein [Hansschlegelia quercus]|nr:di-heme oxidoredictase family protein [Hansschlegelia quercus]